MITPVTIANGYSHVLRCSRLLSTSETPQDHDGLNTASQPVRVPGEETESGVRSVMMVKLLDEYRSNAEKVGALRPAVA